MNTSGDLTHTVTITDDDPDPTVNFSSTSSSGSEGTINPSSITVQLSNATYEDIEVTYAVDGASTATVTDDYTILTTVTITAGNTTANIVPTIIDDVLDEEDETLVINLASVSSGSATLAGSNTTHTYTITDDDPTPTVSFGSSSGSGNESSTETINVSVDLSSASAKTITVPFSYSGDGISGVDFTEDTASPLSFAAGETSKTITFSILDDGNLEETETIQLDMGSPTNVSISGTSQYIYTVSDDETDEVGPGGIGGPSDVVVWLRAHDSYLQERGAGTIRKWTDLSDSGNDPTLNGYPAYTESNADFNGFSTVDFDGTTSGNYISWGDIMNGATEGEVYAVIQATDFPASTTKSGLWDWGNIF